MRREDDAGQGHQGGRFQGCLLACQGCLEAPRPRSGSNFRPSSVEKVCQSLAKGGNRGPLLNWRRLQAANFTGLALCRQWDDYVSKLGKRGRLPPELGRKGKRSDAPPGASSTLSCPHAEVIISQPEGALKTLTSLHKKIRPRSCLCFSAILASSCQGKRTSPLETLETEAILGEMLFGSLHTFHVIHCASKNYIWKAAI